MNKITTTVHLRRELEAGQGVGWASFNHNTWEPEANLVYTVNSRAARANIEIL